jgi:uncharacterized protein
MKPKACFCPHCGVALQTKEIRERIKRERTARVDWRVTRRVIVFYFLYLAIAIPLYWLPDEHMAAGIMIASCVSVILITGYWRISRATLRDSLRLNEASARCTLLGLGILIPMIAMNIGYHTLIAALFEPDSAPKPDPFELAGMGMPIAVFFTCVMPGIWEEIAFRGLIQQRLKMILKPREALFLTSFLFAIIHCAPFSWPYLFVAGLFLGWLRQRSGSLIPGMVVHFVHNLVIHLI